MPYPEPGESKKSYIDRFMKSGEAEKDFPDQKQRVAVAYSLYEKKNSGPFGTEQHPWPRAYQCNFIEPGLVFYQDLGPCKVCGTNFTCGEGKCETEGEMVLVDQDALAKMASTFVGKPVIDVIHKDVQPDTVAEGDADGIVTRVWLDGETGWHCAEYLVWNPETQKHCESAAYSVSCAYEPTEVDESGGEYHNIPYADKILNGTYTHLAIVTSPRYEGARIQLVNSKGGTMSWKFWEKGQRKNAAPIDPSKEMVNVDGKDVPLKELYDSLPEEKKEEEKYNDDTMLQTPKGDKTLGELKQAYRNKMKANANGEDIKTSAPADSGHGSHEESASGSFQHGSSCDHCRHPAFNDKQAEEAPGEKKPLPDLRHSEENPDEAEIAAKELDKAAKEKQALELQQAKDDEAAKMAEEKKNAEDKAKEEMRQAEEKAAKEKELANSKKEAGKKAFADLRNAREREFAGENSRISPVSIDDRLARGAKKYGSAA